MEWIPLLLFREETNKTRIRRKKQCLALILLIQKGEDWRRRLKTIWRFTCCCCLRRNIREERNPASSLNVLSYTWTFFFLLVSSWPAFCDIPSLATCTCVCLSLSIPSTSRLFLWILFHLTLVLKEKGRHMDGVGWCRRRRNWTHSFPRNLTDVQAMQSLILDKRSKSEGSDVHLLCSSLLLLMFFYKEEERHRKQITLKRLFLFFSPECVCHVEWREREARLSLVISFLILPLLFLIIIRWCS